MASLYRKPILVFDAKLGRRTKTKAKKWWGRFRDASGREKRVPLAIDRAAAQAMLNECVRRVEREKVGLIEPTDEHRKRPMAEHLRDYERHLKAKENAPRYVALAVARTKALLTGCKFRTIGNIAPSSVANWLRKRRDENAFGIATSNDYLVAAKAFCNWLKRDGRLGHNPLAHLQRLNAETDIRRQRRVLTPDELSRLFAAAESDKRKVCRLRGTDRAMVYRMAAYTGLRAQELASLTPRSFDLAANPPTVRVEACYSKHRRNDVLPLEADLCQRLRTYLSQRAAANGHVNGDDRLWQGKWYRKAARMMQGDLAAARKSWIKEMQGRQARKERDESDFLRETDSAGRVADFHALRHGFITYLVTANVPPKVAQMLARHSTITLTMDRYTHLAIEDLAAALKRLPVISADFDIGDARIAYRSN